MQNVSGNVIGPQLLMKAKYFIIYFMLMCTFDCAADTVDNYQIYINKRLVFNDSGFGSFQNCALTYRLAKKNYQDTFSVFFNHCTGGASQRQIQLRDRSGKVIEEWSFVEEDVERRMQIPIRSVKAKLVETDGLKLYYFDKSLSEGRLLMTVYL